MRAARYVRSTLIHNQKPLIINSLIFTTHIKKHFSQKSQPTMMISQ